MPDIIKSPDLKMIELCMYHGVVQRTISPRIAWMRIASSISSVAKTVTDALYAASGPASEIVN
mgnify:CR=1 FL=1